MSAKIFLLLLFFLFFISKIFSQPLFDRGYQYGLTEYNLKLIELPGGSYFLFGGDEEPLAGFLGKLSSDGNLLWANRYLFDNYGAPPVFHSAVVDTDKNVVFAVSTVIPNSGALVKMDTDGNVLWNLHFNFPIRDVLLTNDGYYFAVGAVHYAYADSDWDIHAYRVAHDGSFFWERHYFSNDYFSSFNYEDKFIYSAAKTAAGDFMILFDHLSDKCVMKISSSGNFIWLKKYYDDVSGPSTLHYSTWKILTLKDGSILVCGKEQTAPATQELIAFKITTNGYMLWSKKYTYNENVALLNAFQLPDSNVILFAEINAPNFQNDHAILTIDNDGHLLSSFEVKPQTKLSYLYPDWFGMNAHNQFALIQAGGNDVYGNDTTQIIMLDSDFYSTCTYDTALNFIEVNPSIAAFDSFFLHIGVAVLPDSTPLLSTPRIISEEDLCLPTYSTLSMNNQEFQVSPVPSIDFITITMQYTFENVLLQLNDAFGRMVYKRALAGNTRQEVVDVSNLPPGIYWMVMTTESSTGTKKIVIQR